MDEIIPLALFGRPDKHNWTPKEISQELGAWGAIAWMDVVFREIDKLVAGGVLEWTHDHNFVALTPNAVIPQVSPEQLAIYLHRKLCRHDHTEHCGWYYRNPNDPETWEKSRVHKDYLSTVRAWQSMGVDLNLAMQIVSFLP